MDLEGTDGRERGEVINSVLDVVSYHVVFYTNGIFLCIDSVNDQPVWFGGFW